jgi:Fungal specific transcription factor domain
VLIVQSVSEETERKISPASPTSQPSQTKDSPYESTAFPHRSNVRQVKWETDISVDDEGGVTFHNSTSAVHQPPSEVHGVTNQMPLAHAIALAKGPDDQNSRRALVSNATKQKQWEDYAIANTAVKANVSKEVSKELLRYHWCWIHPLFLVVYRPAFIRGMALVNTNVPDASDPPYFSGTLLKVIHAHCARFLNHAVHQHEYQTLPNTSSPVQVTMSASEFMEKMSEEARISLGMETLKHSSIPTIQALLQQSAREIVFGHSSQGWLYSGMAFRMAFDMGIHLPSDKLQMFVKSLSPEDIEIRKRLFWSCYTWDKIISLYLGRMPGFTPSTEDIPLTFMDDYSDTDLWAPYYGETPGPDVSPANYLPRPGYVVSCFMHLCKLCIILNDLMQGIYSPTSPNTDSQASSDPHSDETRTSESSFIRLSRSLHTFWTDLPPHLLIPPSQIPLIAPPVHIISLNLTYHTTLILLHRPLILSNSTLHHPAAQKSYTTCIAATAAIHDLLVLQANTFGLSHVSYLNAYAAYIAATIAVLRFEREHKPGEDHTLSTSSLGLNFLLEVLQRTASAIPALDRSVAIIRKRMKAVLDGQAQTQLKSLFPTASSTPTSYAGMSPVHDLSNPTPTSSFRPVTACYDPSTTFAQPGIPMAWQSSVRGSLYAEPSFSEDFLPAFPGQQFPVGTVESYGNPDGEMINPAARAALMGYNLDPHPTLDNRNLDWNFVDAFMSGEQELGDGGMEGVAGTRR